MTTPYGSYLGPMDTNGDDAVDACEFAQDCYAQMVGYGVGGQEWADECNASYAGVDTITQDQVTQWCNEGFQ